MCNNTPHPKNHKQKHTNNSNNNNNNNNNNDNNNDDNDNDDDDDNNNNNNDNNKQILGLARILTGTSGGHDRCVIPSLLARCPHCLFVFCHACTCTGILFTSLSCQFSCIFSLFSRSSHLFHCYLAYVINCFSF